jgi:uncharacterized protein YjeT (DUF2065 family)
MHKTRLSFFYLVFYLIGGGLGFAADPRMALEMFGSTGEYAEPMVRLAGILMLGLGAMVVQLIRHRQAHLYSTVLVARLFILACLLGLYMLYADPLFTGLFMVVALGVGLTLVCYRLDGRAAT